MGVDADIRPLKNGEEAALAALWERAGLVRPWNDPLSDIALAKAAPSAEILVGLSDGAIAASALVGFDGHRGWMYYVAVDPDRQGQGLGLAMMAAGEAWLSERDCPKVEVILRGDNAQATGFYDAAGYRREDRILMSKWLKTPPAPQDEPTTETGPAMLDYTVTYLEMAARPATAPRRPPVAGAPLSLIRLYEPTVGYYRYIQHTVGDPWLWWERKAMSDAELAEIIGDEAVEIYVLSVGGVPAGFVELDFRAMPDRAEIAYFGLFEDFIGRGLGGYLLDWSVHCAWNRTPGPTLLTVNTCTLDHPGALPAYQKAGFIPVGREEKRVADPRA